MYTKSISAKKNKLINNHNEQEKEKSSQVDVRHNNSAMKFFLFCLKIRFFLNDTIQNNLKLKKDNKKEYI